MGFRVTPERIRTLEAALNYQGHFTADELYLVIQGSDQHVSRATVYKALELLVKADLLVEVQFRDHTKRFESKFKRTLHDHIHCLECNSVKEFTNTEIEKMIAKVVHDFGYTLSHYSLNIFVHCTNKEDCNNNDSIV